MNQIEFLHIFPERPLGKPTAAQPGTKEKIEVMCLRLSRGQSLFHPKDPCHEWAYNMPKCDTVSLSDLRAALRDQVREYSDER